jgi:hypothetical protein
MDNNIDYEKELITENQAPDKKGQATAGLVLGIVGVVLSIIPLFGLPCGIVGLVMSILGLKSSKKKLAIAGLVLCVITLIITIIFAVMGAIAGAKLGAEISQALAESQQLS